jgi:hypothetical protein
MRPARLDMIYGLIAFSFVCCWYRLHRLRDSAPFVLEFVGALLTFWGYVEPELINAFCRICGNFGFVLRAFRKRERLRITFGDEIAQGSEDALAIRGDPRPFHPTSYILNNPFEVFVIVRY